MFLQKVLNHRNKINLTDFNHFKIFPYNRIHNTTISHFRENESCSYGKYRVLLYPNLFLWSYFIFIGKGLHSLAILWKWRVFPLFTGLKIDFHRLKSKVDFIIRHACADLTLQKRFPLRISSIRIFSVSCGFGHIYWRNP